MKKFIALLFCIFVFACWQEQGQPDSGTNDFDTEDNVLIQPIGPNVDSETETEPPDTDPPG